VEYVRDSRFCPLGLAYRFLDDEKTHWLAGNHAIEAWIRSVDWKNTVIVAHNCKFDGAILAWRYEVKPFAWMDTMGLAKAVLGGNVSNHSLKRLAEYLGLSAKGEISCEGIHNPLPEQLAALGEYCKNDVEICKGIYEKLIPQFPQSQLPAMDWTIRTFVEPCLMLNMRELEKGVQDEKARREEIIKKSGVDKSVLSSNKQFAEYLQQHGLSVPTKLSTRTGRSTFAFAKTDAGLSELGKINPTLYAARLASKSNLLETRGESLLAVARTGTFPFDVGFSGAVQTHRYSGGSGAGGNPQNFTRQSFLRKAVCTPNGSSLVVGDFAAIELRILAWLAKEPRLMGKIINDEDIYADFASLKYGRKITKEDKIERQFGKCSILGLGYNMGAKKFKLTVKNQTEMDISEDESWKTVDLYRTTYFNVPKLWEQAHSVLPLISSGKIGCLWFAPFIKVRQNALVLPSGLMIRYPNLRQQGDDWVYDVYKKVYEAETTNLYGGKIIENICQALAGELCKEAIARAESMGLRCVGQVHDEILAICRQDSLRGEAEKEAVNKLKKAMEQSPYWMPTLRLKAEVGWGNNWNESKI
jgi:DNA polymerase I-like protein with 3'-5' exonuclease and polymerase domains